LCYLLFTSLPPCVSFFIHILIYFPPIFSPIDNPNMATHSKDRQETSTLTYHILLQHVRNHLRRRRAQMPLHQHPRTHRSRSQRTIPILLRDRRRPVEMLGLTYYSTVISHPSSNHHHHHHISVRSQISHVNFSLAGHPSPEENQQTQSAHMMKEKAQIKICNSNEQHQSWFFGGGYRMYV